jgi:hypothetical protein
MHVAERHSGLIAGRDLHAKTGPILDPRLECGNRILYLANGFLLFSMND